MTQVDIRYNHGPTSDWQTANQSGEGESRREWLTLDGLSADDRQAIETRFWTKVKKTSGCWVWTGSAFHGGYGQFRINRHPWIASRLAWIFAHGSIPAGLQICHHCDRPACVRLSHLFLGTIGDNIRDAASKDRLTVTRRKKLTLAERLEIFHAPRDRVTGGALARKYGISKVALHHTRNGRFIGSGVWFGTKAPHATVRVSSPNSYATLGHTPNECATG